MMGERDGDAGGAVLRVQPRAARPGGSPAAVDRPVRRPGEHPRAPAAVLQRDGPALDRSGADDPDADRRLLLRHPLGAAAVRGGPSQPRLSLVLPAGPGRRGAGPLDLLEEPARPLPRQRSAAPAVRDDGRALHRRGAGRRRRLRGRCQPDQGGRQPAALGAGRASGCRPTAPSRAVREYLAVLDDAAFGAATPGRAEVHLARRSGRALDRRAGRARLLRLLRPTI